MDNEGFAPNSWSSSYGQKVVPVHALHWKFVHWRDFLPTTDWISCMYLAQFPRRPFCRLIYIQLPHLCAFPTISLLNKTGLQSRSKLSLYV